MALEFAHMRPLGIFASYFLTIIFCFYVIIRSILSPLSSSGVRAPRSATTVFKMRLFTALAVTSLVFTWYSLFGFIFQSYGEYVASARSHISCELRSSGGIATELECMANWLTVVKLFEDAYKAVVEEKERWWWSQQIFLACLAWGAWMPLAWAEGAREGAWGEWWWGTKGRRVLVAYMVFAQLVSLSVAVELFFVDVCAHAAPSTTTTTTTSDKSARSRDVGRDVHKSPPILLTVHLPLALITSFYYISQLPLYTNPPSPNMARHPKFITTLLTPHILLFVPILLIPTFLPSLPFPTPMPASWRKKILTPLLTICIIYSLALHWRVSAPLVLEAIGPEGPKEMLKTLVLTGLGMTERGGQAEQAIRSVSWDVVMVGLGYVVWAGVGGAAAKWAGWRWARMIGWTMAFVGGGAGVGAGVLLDKNL